jgi:threonine dehydratase
MTHDPGAADVEAARARIRPWVRKTPVLAVDADTTGVDRPVLLKLDLLQRTGSFKARGAFNAILAGPVPAAGLVAASGGNHGGAVAYAARALGIEATIFVPETTPALKVERLRGYGAEVRLSGAVYADAFAAAEEHHARTGARLLHAYDEPEVVAGQGTAAAEFAEQAADLGGLDTVIVAVGGGGLLGGTLAALERLPIRVVAVETEGTPTLSRALAAGWLIPVDVAGLAADSLGARTIGAIGFALARRRLHASLLVTDDDVRAAQRRLWDTTRLAAEPGGATALAALTSGRYRPQPDERVGVIVCGGNADPALLTR